MTYEPKADKIELTATEELSAEDPKRQRVARESEERKKEAQRKAYVLMEQLPNLDFANQEAVLDWICDFQYPSNHIDGRDRKKVLKIFAKHGYRPNVNIDEAFNGEDRDNFARYIVGQALGGLRGNVHVIRQFIHKFTDDWKKKFAS